MVCGGFTCSKNTLAALNVLYILVSIILIGVAAYGRVAAIVTSLALVGSLILCGVILFFIALIGLVGSVKHHQVLLFFYMIILFLLFLLQFSLACACLAVNTEQKDKLAQSGWKYASNATRANVQDNFNCCGFGQHLSGPLDHPPCKNVDCCKGHQDAYCCSGVKTNDTVSSNCPCNTCSDELRTTIYSAFSVTGGVGLFFSFTEIIGVVLALRYRNQKDPRANPSAFL